MNTNWVKEFQAAPTWRKHRVVDARVLDALSFEDLRVRWGITGRPLPARTARRYVKQIGGRQRLGRGYAYPRVEVEWWEQQRKMAA